MPFLSHMVMRNICYKCFAMWKSLEDYHTCELIDLFRLYVSRSMFNRGHNCSIKNFMEIINLMIIFIFSSFNDNSFLQQFFSDFRDLETHQLRCKWCHFLHGISWLTTLPSHQVMSVCTLCFLTLLPRSKTDLLT